MTDTSNRNMICKLKRIYGPNRSISNPWYIIFYSSYIIIAAFAFVCNSMLLLSLYRHHKKPKKRSIHPGARFRSQRIRTKKFKICEKTRDNLIGYLATFDLLLSLTMPFTALDVLSEYWPLGRNTQPLARICRAFPSIIINSSSMIIIVIALNCYRQILHSSKKQLSPRKLRYIVVLIISLASLVASPIFYFTKLDPLIKRPLNRIMEEADSANNPSINSTNASNASETKENRVPPIVCDEYNDLDFLDISFVLDDWPISAQNIRLYYSIFSIITQLIVPFFVISILYYSVYKRLARQAEIQRRVTRTEHALKKENQRNKRRNKLLATISLVYLFTWLPLSIFGTLMDANIELLGQGSDTETTTILFMSCHLIGMMSSCLNPILYGYRNKHVRKGNILFEL